MGAGAKGWPTSSPPRTRRAAGRRALLGPITADIDGLTLTNHEVLGLGTTVAALGTYTGTAHRSGRPLSLPYLHIWTVIDDQITEFRQTRTPPPTARHSAEASHAVRAPPPRKPC
jgi:ketosteroid isomerase-like protein